MKYIAKGNSPAELRQWFNGQPVEDGRRINCDYGSMPPTVHRIVKRKLLEEQGGLCCYTGIAVTDANSHIEHFLPQTLCTNHEDVDYGNMLAAYPKDDRRKCPFGAHAKAKWYDSNLLVNPMRGDCEGRFRFSLIGHIQPANPNDNAAKETIAHLCLDHGLLTEYRKQAIDEVLSPGPKQPSKSQLGRIAEAFCTRDSQHRFRPFCFVVQQAAKELLQKAERKRIRDEAIRRERNS